MAEFSKMDVIADIPGQVFEQFLKILGETAISPALVGRLRKALIEDKTFTERALKAAVLGEEKVS